MKIPQILILALLVVIGSVMATATEDSTSSHLNPARHDRLIDPARHSYVRAEDPFYRRAFLHRGVYARPSIYNGLRAHSRGVFASHYAHASSPYTRDLNQFRFNTFSVRPPIRPFYNPSLNFRTVRAGHTRRLYASVPAHAHLRPDLRSRVYLAPHGLTGSHRNLLFRRAQLNTHVNSYPLTTAARRTLVHYA